MTSSEPGKRPGTAQGPARKSVLILTTVIGLGAVDLIVVASKHGRLDSKGHSANSAAEDGRVQESSGASGVAPKRVHSPPALPTAATPSEQDPSDHARQLVKSLREVNLQPGQLTPEKAEEWQRNLEELIEQGTVAVPVLQEFFQGNEDLRFDSGPGTNLLGEPTLRMAFLKVLFDIPAPDNVNLQEQVLRTTTDPDEIALLARQLELQEPGKYREVIIEAAKTALQKTKDGALPGRDTSPLVRILERYGANGVK